MPTLRLTVEYDGRRFHGWQRQPRLRTVQGELEAALATVLREPVSVAGAGRTDAGVHALAQTASLRTAAEIPPQRIRSGVNALTGPDVCVRAITPVADDFHARHSAWARHYAYLLLGEPSAFWGHRALLVEPLPALERLAAAAHALVGVHDFAAFSCATADEDSTHTHLLYARWQRWGRGLMLQVGARRFLYRMVRAIVAQTLDVAAGRLPADDTARRLARPVARATRIAPAHGLHFLAAEYRLGSQGAAPVAPRGGSHCEPPEAVL